MGIGYRMHAKRAEGASDAFEFLLKNVASPEPNIRSEAAINFGLYKGRKSCPALIKLMHDEAHYVVCDAIVGLGYLKDSRALFSLVKYWSAADREKRARILESVGEDPRAAPWLEQLQLNDPYLQRLRDSAKEDSKKAHDSTEFLYTFIGSEEKRLAAEKYAGTIIRTQKDLQRLIETAAREYQCDVFDPRRPQTYVINETGEFVLGGWLQEHVQVASGKDVRAAGEATIIPGQTLSISEINNRSNGYYPSTSFKPVAEILGKTEIPFPDRFTKTFPEEGYFTNDFLGLWEDPKD